MKNRIIRCFGLNNRTNSILASSIVFAIPAEVLSGVYMTENPKTILSKTVRTLTGLLLGIPTIVIGVIVCIWVVVPMSSYSALASIVALLLSWRDTGLRLL